MNSALQRRAETSLWHGQAHMPAVKGAETVLVRGDGAHVWDSRGNRLIDAPASLWYCNAGHGRRDIVASMAAQAEKLAGYHTFQAFANEPALALAERIVELAPFAAGAKVFLTSNGSDAVDGAAKLVRRYWAAVGRPEKRLLVARDRAYHGLHGFGTSLGGLPANSEGYGDLIPDIAHIPCNDWRAFEALIERQGGDTVGAIFCEPIIGTGGVIAPEPDFFPQVQRLCREHDILLVVDEVITGFGRVGEWFASTRFAIAPDLLLFAKGVTSGYLPLGGVIASARIAEPFWRDDSDLIFRHGLTYGGHPTVAAAALANLDVLEREDLLARVRTLEGTLERALRPLAQLPGVVEVRAGTGLLGAVELESPELAASVVGFAWERGILTRQIAFGETLQVSPPFVIDEADVQRIADVFADSIEVAQGRASNAVPVSQS